MYTLYILRTDKNTLYTGITNDLPKRLKTHQMGKGAKYLAMFDSFELVYSHEYKTKSEALRAEAEIKKMKKEEKEKLILVHG